MSLLMEKNRDKLHSLLMLGYPLRKVAAPYMGIVVCASVAAWLFAVVCCVILRSSYLHSLEELGAAAGSLWMAPGVGLVLALLLMTFNIIAVWRKVKASWR